MKTYRLLPVVVACLMSFARPTAAAPTAAAGQGPAQTTTGVERRQGAGLQELQQKALARLSSEHDQRVAERAKEYTTRQTELAARLAKSKLTDAQKSELTTALGQLHQQHEEFLNQCYQKVVSFVTASFSDPSKSRDQRKADREAFHTQMKATIEAEEAKLKAAREALFDKIRGEAKGDRHAPGTPPAPTPGALHPPVGTAA